MAGTPRKVRVTGQPGSDVRVLIEEWNKLITDLGAAAITAAKIQNNKGQEITATVS